jgi:thiamine biosynthesis protein ThiS
MISVTGCQTNDTGAIEVHTTENIQIVLNGDPKQVPAGLTVLGLLRALSIEPARVAVELNRSIVRKPDWETTQVGPGSQIEVVQFVGGG